MPPGTKREVQQLATLSIDARSLLCLPSYTEHLSAYLAAYRFPLKSQMRKELQARLHTVGRKLTLANRLLAALASEEEMIDRMAVRSKKIILDVKSQLQKLVSETLSALRDDEKQVLSEVANNIYSVVTSEGEANSTAAVKARRALKSEWERTNYGKHRKLVLKLFQSFDKFLVSVPSVAALQHPQLVEKAKVDPAFREKYYTSMEKLVTQLQAVQQEAQATRALMTPVVPTPEDPKSLYDRALSVQKSLQDAPNTAQKPVEAPIADEPVPLTERNESTPPVPKAEQKPAGTPTQKDSTAEESVAAQVAVVENNMQMTVGALARHIHKKASDLFGKDSKIVMVLDENIEAIYSNKKINHELNRDANFYKAALYLEQGNTSIDLTAFLDTRNKKSIYLAYRSFVMAARALGVMQYVKTKPELVVNNPKIHEMAVKAQKILQKRHDSILKTLRSMKVQEKEEKDKDVGIPRGTFSDHFESDQK